MRTLFAALALLACGLASAATCNVTEFADRPPVTYQAAFAPALASSNVTFTTSSVQSVVFQQTTTLVRIQCDAVAYILFGTNPTALLTSMRVPSGTVEYYAVAPASVYPYTALRLAVIGP